MDDTYMDRFLSGCLEGYRCGGDMPKDRKSRILGWPLDDATVGVPSSPSNDPLALALHGTTSHRAKGPDVTPSSRTNGSDTISVASFDMDYNPSMTYNDFPANTTLPLPYTVYSLEDAQPASNPYDLSVPSYDNSPYQQDVPSRPRYPSPSAGSRFAAQQPSYPDGTQGTFLAPGYHVPMSHSHSHSHSPYEMVSNHTALSVPTAGEYAHSSQSAENARKKRRLSKSPYHRREGRVPSQDVLHRSATSTSAMLSSAPSSVPRSLASWTEGVASSQSLLHGAYPGPPSFDPSIATPTVAPYSVMPSSNIPGLQQLYESTENDVSPSFQSYQHQAGSQYGGSNRSSQPTPRGSASPYLSDRGDFGLDKPAAGSSEDGSYTELITNFQTVSAGGADSGPSESTNVPPEFSGRSVLKLGNHKAGRRPGALKTKSVACLPCREKRSKCEGKEGDTCRRCLKLGKEDDCIYTSRRGDHARAKKAKRLQESRLRR